MFRHNLLTVVIVLASFMPALAQDEQQRPLQLSGFVVGRVGVLDNLGYANPQIGIGGGIEMKSSQMLTTTQAFFSVAHKIETGDGSSKAFEVASYKTFNKFLIGAGTNFSQLTTSQWTKHAWRPFAAFGYDGESNRIQARYLVPSYDTQNRLSGILLIYDYRPARHWGMEYRWGLYRFQDTRVPGIFYAQRAEKHTGAEIDIAVKYYF
jgi:hypothetical protein